MSSAEDVTGHRDLDGDYMPDAADMVIPDPRVLYRSFSD